MRYGAQIIPVLFNFYRLELSFDQSLRVHSVGSTEMLFVRSYCLLNEPNRWLLYLYLTSKTSCFEKKCALTITVLPLCVDGLYFIVQGCFKA